jgi:serine/threonine protein kinase
LIRTVTPTTSAIPTPYCSGVSSVSPIAVGDLFAGRYLIEGRLGSGTSGEVWRALDQHRDQVVALKILATTEADDAWQEARRLTELESPNILRVSNADLAIDVPYIASALATCGTAADEMKPFGMAPARAVHLIRGTLRGMQLCHDRRILHRDVKPANIFIGPTGDAQLGDFGHAALMAPDGTGKPHGDPDIRALEVLKGGSCTTSSDVYSAGVSLYAMLTGCLPFSIAALGEFKALRDAVSAGMPDIRDIAPHVSLGLAKVVRKATEAKVADRYTTAAEFNAALAAHAAAEADICRVEPSSADHLDHDGHHRCWIASRRQDGQVIYVCVNPVGRRYNVLVRRGNGRRVVAHCKQSLTGPATIVHLRKVFNALR